MATPPKKRLVGLVPARSGSKRVPDKNIRPLGDHPLLAYTVSAALDSGIFEAVVCSTDSARYARIAEHYGAEVPFLRPAAMAGDTSPDIQWVAATLEGLARAGRTFDGFSILRPTSPFRRPETIRRAWEEFRKDKGADALRAVEPCSQHPGKMWVVRGDRLLPLLPYGPEDPPWHSSQYAALPRVYVQNASLEIAWTRVVAETGTIAGQTIRPFFTSGYEGFDVNTSEDWDLALRLTADGKALLPTVRRPPFVP